MKGKPFFSVTIPTYNRARNLKNAISFILEQSFRDFEIVISDNCSKDNTSEIVRSFHDKRIKYFKTEKHIDVMPSVERSISLSKGEYIFLQGDDDLLIDRGALQDIYTHIKKTKTGFIRVNYLSISPNKRHVFDFRESKGFTKDSYIAPYEKNMKTVKFLLKSDLSFLAGIVFKNCLPKSINLLDSQLYSWFPIIFHSTKMWGGLFLNKPYIFASWSKWQVREDNFHSLYSLQKEKLTSEAFFEYIKKFISKKEYEVFLPEQLHKIYIDRFMAIKLNVGNRSLIKLANRLRVLAPQFNIGFSFWKSLFLALIIPRVILTYIRYLYLIIYIQKNNMDKNYNLQVVMKRIK